MILTISHRAQFIPHDGWSRTMPMAERFAECIAEGMSIAAAERASGVAYGGGPRLMKRFSAPLGDQAK